jgi:transcriptional regulator with XRE-family HTH domain
MQAVGVAEKERTIRMTLGQKIRMLRLAKKMTLQDVASETGYSKALISRIENDSVSPSIGSLMKIASALDIALHQLFAAVDGGQAARVRKQERSSAKMAGGSIQVESLSDRTAGDKMAAVVMTFEGGALSQEGTRGHEGEEWWHVLRGRLEATVGDRVIELAEGDSIYLSSSLPHRWRNPAKSKASALVVVTPLG